jgi:hypothetical protein
MVSAQSYAALDIAMQVLIPLSLVPGESVPGSWLVPTFEANFVSVVYAWRARIGHLKQ